MAEHPSVVRLARLADGTADAAEVEAVTEHLEVCESCRAAMAGVRGSLDRYRQVEERHREQILASRPSWAPRFVPAMLALAVLLVAVFAWRGTSGPGDSADLVEPHTDTLRAKGAVAFEVLLSRGESAATPISARDALLLSGDGLELRVTSPSRGWAFAVIIDENGVMTPLASSAKAVVLPAGTSTPFSVRYVVDGKASAEHVVACAASQPLDAAPLLAALRAVERPIGEAALLAKTSTFLEWECQVHSLRAMVSAVASTADDHRADSETSP